MPQSLQFMGVLEYEEGLFQRLCRGEHLEPGCVEENEIRGCSIWAVEVCVCVCVCVCEGGEGGGGGGGGGVCAMAKLLCSIAAPVL